MELTVETILKLRLLWVLLGLFISQPLAAQSFNSQALIELKSNPVLLPLVEHGTRDPSLSYPSDDLGFEQLWQQSLAAENELKIMQGLRKEELLEQTYLNFVRISYFLEDVKAKRLDSSYNQGTDTKLLKARRSLEDYAKQLASSQVSKAKRLRASYHALVSSIVSQSGNSRSVKILDNLSSKLPAKLKRRAEFLTGLHQLHFTNREKGETKLRSLIEALPSSSAISARLAIARSKAGMNSNARKVRKTDSDYRKWLARAVYRARDLSISDRESVLAFAVGVWQQAESRKIDWRRPPFNLKGYTNLAIVDAMKERIALTEASRRRYSSSIKIYKTLSNKYTGSFLMGKIDERILQLYKIDTQRRSAPKSYQSVLIEYQNKYSNSERNFNPSVAQKMNTAIGSEHRRLVSNELNLGTNKRSSRNKRLESIQIAETYLTNKQSSPEYKPMREKVAQIHILNKNHKIAVAIYRELMSMSQDKEYNRYLNLAIDSQRVLANWPKNIRWAGRPASGDTQARSELKSFYEESYKGNPNWDSLAHIGWIMISLGDEKLAHQMWFEKLKSSKEISAHTRNAAGHLLLAFEKDQDWQALEDLTKLSMNYRLAAIYRGKTLNLKDILGRALFAGGMKRFEDKQWALAVEKLKEFSDKYKTDKRRPKAMFYLGQSYHNNGNYPLAVETMVVLVNQYPKSIYIKESLYLGGSWSIPMAYEEQVIFFYQRFVERYSGDSRTPSLREELLKLYMGRAIYGHATRTHQAILADSRSNQELKIRSALAVMDIEERYGEDKTALWGAKKLIQLASNRSDLIAKAYAFQLRRAARKQDFAQVEAIERRLVSLSGDSEEQIEALAQARFIIAESRVEITNQEFFNLSLTDPAQVLKRQFKIFKGIQSLYEKVCEPSISSYCAPALMRLSETTKNTLSSIENITIAQTLDDKTVESFESYKLKIVSYLANLARKSDEKALAIVEKGQSTPGWSKEFMWAKSNNWNFDASNPTSGNGYVQWAPVMLPQDK